jgi:hypothetical protein
MTVMAAVFMVLTTMVPGRACWIFSARLGFGYVNSKAGVTALATSMRTLPS